MTLKGGYVLLFRFENTCIYGVHHGFLNDDTHIITGKNAGVLTV